MSRAKLETRVASLESQLAILQAKVQVRPAESWLDSIYGAFADDPVYDEAMRLGREYRESLRPKQAQKRGAKKSNGNSRHGSGHAARKGK